MKTRKILGYFIASMFLALGSYILIQDSSLLIFLKTLLITGFIIGIIWVVVDLLRD